MISIINTQDNLTVTAISLIILIFFNAEFLLNLVTLNYSLILIV
jgi:hypothetical protein